MTPIGEIPIEFSVAYSELLTRWNRVIDEDLSEVRAAWPHFSDMPVPLILGAIRRAIRTRRFFPLVSELRQDAEVCRLELAAAHPFVPCLACRDRRPGWVVVIDPSDVPREARCDCWRDHQQQLAAGGYTPKPVYLALPAATQEIEA